MSDDPRQLYVGMIDAYATEPADCREATWPNYRRQAILTDTRDHAVEWPTLQGGRAYLVTHLGYFSAQEGGELLHAEPILVPTRMTPGSTPRATIRLVCK